MYAGRVIRSKTDVTAVRAAFDSASATVAPKLWLSIFSIGSGWLRLKKNHIDGITELWSTLDFSVRKNVRQALNDPTFCQLALRTDRLSIRESISQRTDVFFLAHYLPTATRL